MQLNIENLICLAKGASILTTGGGLCLADQLQSLSKHRDVMVELRDLNNFDPKAILVTAGEVGPADAKEMDKSVILPKMLATWEKLTRQKIAGVYAPELGQEAIIIDTAVGLNVPLVDFDVAGGRAVPFVDINSFYALGMNFSIAPLVAASDQGDVIAVDTPMEISKVETLLRSITTLSKSGIAYFIGGGVQVGDIINSDIRNNSLSRAINLGQAKSLEEIESILSPLLTFKGKVTEKQEINKDGFNCFEAKFKTDKETLTLFILNELLFIKDRNGKILVSPPDKIMIVDEASLTGLSSKDLLSGMDAILYTIDADNLWKSQKGLSIFGSDRFNW